MTIFVPSQDMGEERRFPIAEAHEAAEELRRLLAPGCERIEIAGSIRRGKATVKDIELVAVPRIDQVAGMDLWGSTEPVDRLQEIIDRTAIPLGMVAVRRTSGLTELQYRDGQSYKRLQWGEYPVDLFIVRPPADWGVIFAIRTGPADWSQALVTGCQRFFRRVEGGRVLHLGHHVPCPEEADFLRAMGQAWVDPAERSADRVHQTHPDRVAS